MFEEILEESKGLSAMSAPRALAMTRYFLELHVEISGEKSRILQDEIRRHKAFEFIEVMGEWFKDFEIAGEVSSMSVTAMGQVMIVCTHRVIDLIRSQDVWGITHIRATDQRTDLSRIGRV